MFLKAMDPNFQVDGSTKAGTIGGTLLILFINLRTEEVLKTAILAAIGALVSFAISMILKLLIKRFRRK
jgi:hypothetical protein